MALGGNQNQHPLSATSSKTLVVDLTNINHMLVYSTLKTLNYHNKQNTIETYMEIQKYFQHSSCMLSTHKRCIALMMMFVCGVVFVYFPLRHTSGHIYVDCALASLKQNHNIIIVNIRIISTCSKIKQKNKMPCV